jgi:hypothetical protein
MQPVISKLMRRRDGKVLVPTGGTTYLPFRKHGGNVVIIASAIAGRPSE